MKFLKDRVEPSTVPRWKIRITSPADNMSPIFYPRPRNIIDTPGNRQNAISACSGPA
jgi:hypothetical protein